MNPTAPLTPPTTLRPRTVTDAVCDAIAAAGIDTIFAIAGGPTLHLLAGLSGRGIRIIHCHTEHALVAAADGHTRATGRPACACVTAGPGLTGTATALAAARAHHSPLLLLAGAVPARNGHHPQRLDQSAFARSVLGASSVGQISYAGDWGLELARAFAAVNGNRPYVLLLPTDVLAADPGPRPLPTSPRHQPRPAAPGLIHAAADLLTNATAPGILAGWGARDAGADLGALATRLGAPIATTLPANGLVAGHRYAVGVVGGLGDGRADRALAECDVVLAIGTSVHPLAAPTLADGARVIRVDHSPTALWPVSPALPSRGGLAVRGDAAATLTALRTCVESQLSTSRPLPEPVAAIVADPAPRDPRPYCDGPDGLDPRHVLAALRDVLPADARIVISGGHAAITASQTLSASGLRSWTVVSTDFGAIGCGLPCAIGMALASDGRRVVHVTGDSDLLNTLAELRTAVRYDLPITVIVMNDGGYGQERHVVAARGYPAALADHPSGDFAAEAAVIGAAGIRIDSVDDLSWLEAAVTDDGGVVVVDVAISPAYINPQAEPISQAMSASDQAQLTEAAS